MELPQFLGYDSTDAFDVLDGEQFQGTFIFGGGAVGLPPVFVFLEVIIQVQHGGAVFAGQTFYFVGELFLLGRRNSGGEGGGQHQVAAFEAGDQGG